VAVLAADGVDTADVERVKAGLLSEGAIPEVIGPHAGSLHGEDGGAVSVDKALPTAASVMYNAVVLPGGKAAAEALGQVGDAMHFVTEAFKHGKTIGALGEGVDLIVRLGLPRCPHGS
jgi:catalase